MELFKKIIKISKDEINGKCPWVSSLKNEEIIKQLKGEINELEEELKKGNKEEIIKETGDVLRDAILLFYTISKNEKINEEEILESIIKKIKYRKPWLFNNEKITKEEAVKIWYEKKAEEKQNK